MRAEELEIGNIYFICAWQILDVQVPKIETRVYFGTHEDPKYKGEHIFVDPEWYYGTNKEDRLSYMAGNSNYCSISTSEISVLVSNLEDLKAFVQNFENNEDAHKIFSA